MITPQRGIMTITLLILLSGFLLLTMLFNDDLLRLYSSIAAQRHLYVEQLLPLQQLSFNEKKSRCEKLSTQENGDAFLATFRLENNRLTDGLSHYVWCRRDKLFQKQPVRNQHEKLFDQFISKEGLALFRQQLQSPPLILSKSSPAALYWFTANETEWEIDKNVNAVIVAEGDLHIRGQGKISGSIITKGRLTLDENIKVTYSKSTVTQIVQQYSRWRLAEKSWYDFVVPKN